MPELARVHLREPIQRRIDEFRARLRGTSSARSAVCVGIACGFCRALIPRADILTNVAAEEVAADGSAKLFRNISLFLNREVCNAP